MASVIYTFIYSEVGADVQIKPLRGWPLDSAHSLLMTLMRFFGKKGLRLNIHSIKKILLCRVTLWNGNRSMPVCSLFGEYQLLVK